ncbi:MAG: TetR/AcrR family transcriptional regulator [Casimicrobium sp.]
MKPLKAESTIRKPAVKAAKTTVPAKVSRRTPEPEPEPKPYHHGNLRESLLEAADIVLAREGALGITLREVAKQAGVSHAAPYHHFASLDDMLAAVAERGFLRLSEAMATRAQAADSGERLLQITDVYVSCARANPAQFRLMFGPLLARKSEFPPLKVAAESAFGLVHAAARAHDAEDGSALALVCWSFAHGLSNLLIDGAFDGLPMELPAVSVLTKQLAQRVLMGVAIK